MLTKLKGVARKKYLHWLDCYQLVHGMPKASERTEAYSCAINGGLPWWVRI